MRRVVGTTIVFFACLVGMLLSGISPTHASSLIGTHLGGGEIGQQIAIIQNILVPNGLEPGSPITVTANANGVANPNERDIENLANAVSAAGYFPIVRLTNVCEKLDSDDLALTAVNRVRQVFGPEVIIVYGNEVNNQEVECQDGQRFINQFNLVKNIPNVVPGPLDFYNCQYPATSARAAECDSGAQAFVGENLYSGLSVAAGNGYGCEGESAESCPVPEELGASVDCSGSVASYEKGYAPYGASRLYLTEFSLFPAGPSPIPDTNLKKVDNFIQQCGPQTGALKITPLIRNPCAGVEGEWLLYINGKYFTIFGDPVDPDSCEASSSNLNLSDYPEYDIVPDDYYIQAVIGLTDESAYTDTERNYKDIRADLIAQGYKAYCAVPEQKIKPIVNTQDLVQKFVDQYGLPPQEERTVTSRQVLNLESVRAPLFRYTGGKYFLTSSFETFFGFKDVFSDDASVSEITSAPINSLLTEKQRCRQSAELLAAQKLMCMKLADESQCGLYEREIPGTDFTVKTLMDRYEVFAESIPLQFAPAGEKNILAGADKVVCDALYSAQIGDLPAQYNDVKLREGMQRLPYFIDQNYRLAFLVASIEIEPPEPGFLFNFFTDTPDHPNGIPRDEVLAVAFKIPDIGTDKGTVGLHAGPSKEKGGSIDYPDPIIATRNTLITKQKQQEIFDEREEGRANRYLSVNNFDTQDTGSNIYCLEGSGDIATRTGSPACKDHLTKALVDMINAFGGGCGDPEAEQVRLIGESGGLGDLESARRTFLAEYSEQILKNLFLEDTTHEGPDQPQRAEQEFESILQLGENPGGKESAFKLYLVYPAGYELGYVTSVLENSFFSSEQLAKFSNDPTRKELLAAIGGGGSFSGGSYSKEFNDLSQPPTCRLEPNEFGVPVLVCDYPKEKFTIKAKKEGGSGFGVLGGYLGFWTRKAQLTLNSAASRAYSYVASCKTTEEFLLGRCGGSASGIGNVPSGPWGNPSDPRCQPLDSGPCSVENLKASLKARAPTLSELELDTRATKASIICNKESGGNADTVNDKCVSGESVDYSIGLYQINLLPAGRCPGNESTDLFSDAAGNPQTSADFDAFNLPCTVLDQPAVDACTSHYQNAETNIEWMWNASSNGQTFYPTWSAAFPQYCNIP